MKFILLIALSFVCAVSASSYGYVPEPAPYYEEKIVYIPGPPGKINIFFILNRHQLSNLSDFLKAHQVKMDIMEKTADLAIQVEFSQNIKDSISLLIYIRIIKVNQAKKVIQEHLEKTAIQATMECQGKTVIQERRESQVKFIKRKYL